MRVVRSHITKLVIWIRTSYYGTNVYIRIRFIWIVILRVTIVAPYLSRENFYRRDGWSSMMQLQWIFVAKSYHVWHLQGIIPQYVIHLYRRKFILTFLSVIFSNLKIIKNLITWDLAKVLICEEGKYLDGQWTPSTWAWFKSLEYMKSTMVELDAYCKLLLSLRKRSPPTNKNKTYN